MRSYVYGSVRETARTAIYVIRVRNELIDQVEAHEIAELMRDRLQARGYSVADVVVAQGERKENLRLYGVPYSVGRVRAAMFNAAISWRPIELD
jgi:hypothetical protein